ncbi:MAG: ATP-binding cassette domain-containing protein [Lachnospiraceae bacterium]
MATILEAKEVTKTYEKAGRPSLRRVSFRVDEGEFIGIMGASGSGKTTLLNVLSTIDTPTSGDIWINGVNLKKLNNTSAADFRKDNLGFIFQEYFYLIALPSERIYLFLLPFRSYHLKRLKIWYEVWLKDSVLHLSLINIPVNYLAVNGREHPAARAIVKQTKHPVCR